MGYRVKLLERLTEKFESLPGIGYKSAERMAFYVLSLPTEEAKDFAEAIIESSEKPVRCEMCGCFSEDEVCDICKDESRETSTICVVQSMKDVFAFERINEYHGLYHVLHGLISPMDGISPDDINIPKLLERVQKSGKNAVSFHDYAELERTKCSAYHSDKSGQSSERNR